jgi:hypothetical protein
MAHTHTHTHTHTHARTHAHFSAMAVRASSGDAGAFGNTLAAGPGPRADVSAPHSSSAVRAGAGAACGAAGVGDVRAGSVGTAARGGASELVCDAMLVDRENDAEDEAGTSETTGAAALDCGTLLILAGVAMEVSEGGGTEEAAEIGCAGLA